MANFDRKVRFNNENSNLTEPSQSFGELVGILIKQVTSLIKGEIALAKAQLQERAEIYASAAAFTVGGVALGLLAAIAFLAAGIIALGGRVGYDVSAAIFGTALAVPAILLTRHGWKLFK